MLLSATLSKPIKNIKQILGQDFLRVKIKIATSANADTKTYIAEFYTKTQVFHKKMTEQEVEIFLQENISVTFKNCVEYTETEEITFLTNKKGELKKLVKKIDAKSKDENSSLPMQNLLNGNFVNNKKNYLLPEGIPVPFLVRLGIMTAEGKIISSKYDKFRQINRFLEILNDILPQVQKAHQKEKPLSIVDFGSGKSYLTFAVQHYLTQILKIDCQIFGLDLKKDVIDYCSKLANELSLKNLNFAVGDIESFEQDKHPDIIITLHACDTATDFALAYAVKRGATAILSVPCCQHEINLQLKKTNLKEDFSLQPLLKYGLIKERFSALVTDAVRAEFLEKSGYNVQILEFIDESSTPKNLMIRAIKNFADNSSNSLANCKNLQSQNLLNTLGVKQTLWQLDD
ncbi:class I SAM-dependent methyltransferase [Treponema pectinovorum]|uniref:class I SAM-dependent methyltransferase n=1 Tax=Treponema pectinovorum TaxID=164 RepID=UPI003D8F81E6